MAWTDAYIGIPFLADGRDHSGLDCWGLVALVYRERLGVDLPDYAGIYSCADRQHLEAASAVMLKESTRQWQEVEAPREYDVVLMRRGPLPCHVGLYVPARRMLHILKGTDSALDRIDGTAERDRIVGMFRYAG